MCGIAGYAGWNVAPETGRGVVRAMCDAIEHRGPDDHGYYVAPGVGLGMRRLSIIDVAHGQQPIGNEDGTVQVVFNGEIYNHHALRNRLIEAGHRFATHADTETLVHLYEDLGDNMVAELRGMFGFALWDARRRRLLVARDRLGIKPLAYWETDGGLAFCSELRSLVALDRFPREINRAAVGRYLQFGYVPDPDAVFAGVHKLPPGCALSWSADEGVRVWRYWSPVLAEQQIGEHDAVAELQRLLDDAVTSHLESEVPLGAFLSGGVDSSTVVALASRAVSHRLQTFAIGFDEHAYNEAPDARAVADALGTDHTDLVIRPDVEELFSGLIGAFDEPFADSSSIPTYLVSQLARQHVTVSLSGDGGDELFGGYTRYFDTLAQPRIPAPMRPLLRAIGRHLPHAFPGRNRLIDLGRPPQGQYAATVVLPTDLAEGGVAADDIVRTTGLTADALVDRFATIAERDFATQMTLVDVLTYLPGDILTKVDRTTMAVSLEARVPLLDHPLVEFALSLPSHLKFQQGKGKRIFRKAISTIVPEFVLTKRKQGFAVPLEHWFRGPLRHRVDALLDPSSAIREFVNANAVERIAREHRVGRRDHSSMLWRLLVLDGWIKHLEAGTIGRPSTNPLTSMDVAPVASATPG
jgi:asparagine synthase (glutamine-hydrolysing)